MLNVVKNYNKDNIENMKLVFNNYTKFNNSSNIIENIKKNTMKEIKIIEMKIKII